MPAECSARRRIEARQCLSELWRRRKKKQACLDTKLGPRAEKEISRQACGCDTVRSQDLVLLTSAWTEPSGQRAHAEPCPASQLAMPVKHTNTRPRSFSSKFVRQFQQVRARDYPVALHRHATPGRQSPATAHPNDFKLADLLCLACGQHLNLGLRELWPKAGPCGREHKKTKQQTSSQTI